MVLKQKTKKNTKKQRPENIYKLFGIYEKSHPLIRQEMVRNDFNDTIEMAIKKHNENEIEHGGKRKIEMIILIVAEKVRNIIIIKIDVPEIPTLCRKENVRIKW